MAWIERLILMPASTEVAMAIAQANAYLRQINTNSASSEIMEASSEPVSWTRSEVRK